MPLQHVDLVIVILGRICSCSFSTGVYHRPVGVCVGKGQRASELSDDMFV